jgi:histidinol-phosphatase
VDEHDLRAELAFAQELADMAAAITTAAFGGRLDVKLKADHTPVTQADVGAERAIRAAVAAAFPEDDVLGEEDGRTGPGGNGRTWIVDPIDGTMNFAAGIPLWSTLIALAVDGRPALGLVDVPPLRRRYHAVRGGGAWMNGSPIAVSAVTELSEALVLHSGVEEWTSGPSAVAGPGLDALVRVVEGSRRSRGLSDAVGHALVAEGSAEVLLERSPCGEWDWAACMVVVEEAGGRMTTLDGATPRHGCDLLVSNGGLHEQVLGLLRP